MGVKNFKSILHTDMELAPSHQVSAIDPRMFTFALTFNVLLIVVLGGTGSITGSVIAAIAVTITMEALRFLDGLLNLFVVCTKGLPGLRMVVFCVIILVVIRYRQQGLMGTKEFSWDAITKISRKGAKEI